MKRIFQFFLALTVIAASVFAFSIGTCAYSSSPLDEIENYIIQIDMRNDGTMDIKYHIEWKVLDSSSEGPLEWVKIGNPNSNVDEITALSDNIREISYYSENGGSYIRADFDRAYYENEIVTFDYSIHQSYMYLIDETNKCSIFSFTPGWFEDIEVKNITVKWNAENVIQSSFVSEDNGYLIQSAALGQGERITQSVNYDLNTFTLNPEMQYVEGDSGASFNSSDIIPILVIILFITLFFVRIYSAINRDDYNNHGGFFTRRNGVFIHHGSSSCASSCACACACACAGGGRAGCSKKDFYKTNLKVSELKKRIGK